jgi:ribonuclease-3
LSKKRRKPISRKVINSQLSKLLSSEILASDNFYRAMTHRSMGGKHNERMEFLGDSILGLVITSRLYSQLPNASEGYLSRLRASLVNEDSLADLAIMLSISEHIRLGSGELKSGGFRRKSILADAFEAVVGCIYLEQGIDEATQFILTVYEKRLDTLPPENALKDPKSRLQELLQSKGYNVPAYALLFITGEAHKQTFIAECCVKPLNFCTKGIASSRRKAEQKAAASAIVKVKNLLT